MCNAKNVPIVFLRLLRIFLPILVFYSLDHMSICLMRCSYLCERVLRMMLFHEWLNIRDGMQSFGLDKWLVCRFCISRRLMFLLLVVLCNILVLFVRLLFREIVELLHEIC